MDKTEYTGFFAEFYDILHQNQKDVKAYLEIAKQYGSNILEIGSGTGRILVPLAKEGFHVTGLELNQDMIEICRQKLEKEPMEVRERIHLVQGDMRDFLLHSQFDLIIAPCNVINHLLNSGDLEKALICIRQHLSANGVLIIDNSMPDMKAMVESNGIEEVFEFVHPAKGTRIVDRFRASYDFVNQLEFDMITITEYDGEKKLREAKAQEIFTYYHPRELRVALKHCGYEIIEERGSLLNGGAITEKSREMVFFCKALHTIEK